MTHFQLAVTILVLGSIVILWIAWLFSIKEKRKICKYDGSYLKPSGTGSLHCPKCKRAYYEVNGKLEEKAIR